jgi:hypothetical protein
MHARSEASHGGPFDRDVLSAAMVMQERYGAFAIQRARNRVAWLAGPRNARARLLWTHVVAAIAFLEGIARWRRVDAIPQ